VLIKKVFLHFSLHVSTIENNHENMRQQIQKEAQQRNKVRSIEIHHHKNKNIYANHLGRYSTKTEQIGA
jgi:hypothetical protein